MDRHPQANLLVGLDPRAPIGLQQQIYQGIRRAIVEGVVRPGMRIPSSRALAAELGVSRTTSSSALDQLLAEGYLATRHGSGTFVAADLPDDLPRVPQSREAATRRDAPFSRRGALLAGYRLTVRRLPGPPRAFRLGVPALDRFPVQLWSQLANRRQRSISSVQLDYGPSGGLPALREAIADHIGPMRGTRCHADQIHIVGGAQHGLSLLCQLLIEPGDRAWMEDPGYPGAWTALAGAGAAIVPVPVDAEGLDAAAGARSGGAVRLAYVTPSHQFPLGVTMSGSRRRALLEWARAAGAWVIEDDYDSEFRYGVPPTPCLHSLDADERVIYLGSFSKSVFPSLRLGFLILPPGMQEPLRAARRAGMDLHPPFLEQAVLADFIAGGHFARHLRRMRAIYRERLDALSDAAARYCRGALRLRPVRSGLHAIADVEGADADRVAEEAFVRGVEVMPLSAYVFGGAPTANALLMGFGAVGPEAVERGMRALAAAIEAARPRVTL